MVAPVRDLGNKFFNSSANTHSQQDFDSTLPTVSSANYTGMDSLIGQLPAFNFEVRGRTPTANRNLSRDSLMMSSGQEILYHDKMDINMDCDSIIGDFTSELSYKTEQEKALYISKAADHQEPIRPMDGNNKAPPTHVSSKESTINIQLPYDLQALTEPDLWSGLFHPISLHGSIEYFASDTKNIMVTLDFMVKYITNKQVNSSRANDLNDFDGMGDAIWKFISSVYEAKWDSLYTDNKTNTLRAKIFSKFTSRTTPNKNNNKKDIAKPVPTSIEKAPPLFLLLAKSKSEVNMILKYFKETNTKSNLAKPTKLYAQASKQPTSTSDIFKIKESFPALNANQINRVNNIVKGNPKLKPHIQMTMKGPSRKQIIVPMSGDNSNSFMKNSSTHISNLNRLLRNAKTEIVVDFIRSNPIGLVIITNKVAIQSDLQIIDQYVKKSEDINELQVEESCLSQSKSYLKITGILYFLDGRTQECLNASNIKTVLKQNQIFNNIKLALRPRVIKVSPKSDIWDYQSGKKAKCLINQCFNFGRYIATI